MTDTATPTPASSSRTRPDADLLSGIARGDSADGYEFVQRYQHRLIGYLTARLGDRHQAEDVAQDVFLRLFRAHRGQAGYAGRASVATWLFTIARNRLIDLQRYVGRRPVTLHADLPDPTRAPDPASPGEGPADTAERRETQAQLLQHLAELPEPQREAIELKVLAGLTFRQIAELTGEPASTLKSRTARGLSTLAQHLAESDGRSK